MPDMTTNEWVVTISLIFFLGFIGLRVYQSNKKTRNSGGAGGGKKGGGTRLP